MARRLFVFDRPDRFVARAVGPPGQRRFFLQARKAGAVVSVAVEKVQVAALAARLREILEAVEQPEPASAPVEAEAEALEEPIIDLFTVGAMALAWDPETQMVVVEARDDTEDGEYAEIEDDAEEGPDLVRVRLPSDDAHAFVRRAEALLEAGRPACPFCGQPLNPEGHFCARASGAMH